MHTDSLVETTEFEVKERDFAATRHFKWAFLHAKQNDFIVAKLMNEKS